jgi:hypothetical protein
MLVLSCYQDVDRDKKNINAVLRRLSLQRTRDEEAVGEVVHTHERLCEMVLPDLHVIRRNKNLPVSGTKAVLIERILSGTRYKGNKPWDKGTSTVLSVLMKTWFLAPFKSKACREGTLNKPYIFFTFPFDCI